MDFTTTASDQKNIQSLPFVKAFKRIIALKRIWIIVSLLLFASGLYINPHVLFPASQTALELEPKAFTGFTLDWASILAFLGLLSFCKFLYMCIKSAEKRN